MKKHTRQAHLNYDRREFVKLGALGGIALAMESHSFAASQSATGQETSTAPTVVPPLPSVRIGFVGIGGMGSSHLRNLLKIEGVEIRAVCDIVEGKVASAQELVTRAGKPKPKGYCCGETGFRRLCEQEDLDLVYTATPWEWHTPVCLAAMNNGKHAATEIPAAVTLEECWALVETAEKTGRHCVMLENCCYDRTELMILNMVRRGLFGELLHAQCGYLHDLRAMLLSGAPNGQWRLAHCTKHNADLYPTHGLGPIAQCMNINRGNQFVRLVSMGSPSKGLNLFAKTKYGPESREAKQRYALSDVVSTLIQTAEGQSILVSFGLTSPRPYSRDVLVQGTKGIVRKYPEEKIHLEGKTKGEGWESLDVYREEYDHPLWREQAERGKGGGHGAMDFLVNYRLIQALQKGMPTDIDVYDTAAWSAVLALSEKSIAANNSPVDFPDFTRGKWRTRKS